MFARAVLLVGLTLGLPCTAFELRRDTQGDVVRFGAHAQFVLDAEFAVQLKEGHADAAVKAAVAAFEAATSDCEVSVRLGRHRDLGYVEGQQNQNDIVVLDEWPYDARALAATIVTVNTRTNEIIDADIVFNAEDHRFRVVDQLPANAHGDDDAIDDIQNTLTHELGHALGLMHNEADARVVMYPSALPFETSKRLLASDDREGLHALYAPASATPEAPGAGFGCSSSSSGLSGVGLLVATAMLLRRRRAVALLASLVPMVVVAAEPGSSEVPDLTQAERVSVAQVTARVSASVPGAPGLMMTDVQLTLRECVKGVCLRTFIVRVPGGRLGDLEQVVAHQPVPALNEAVVLVQGPRSRTLLRLADPVHFQRATRAFGRARLAIPVSMATHASPLPRAQRTQVPVVAP